jgi:ABC-type Fe3+-hydroxamate transport system substrate-binding protein
LNSGGAASRLVDDQLGRQVILPDRPKRIISLCPSETETLAALVTPDRIVGCTTYCKYPETLVSGLTKIGGTKRLDFRAIQALRPDLIVSVREENSEEQITALAKDFPTLILDPVDHATTFESIHMLGAAVGEPKRAAALAADIEAALAGLEKVRGQRALYLIWRKPYMAAGSATFIDGMLHTLGFENAASGLSGRYPVIDDGALNQVFPEVILAASEPFPFEEKHRAELQARFPTCRICLVDGEAFGWHGVRTLQVTATLNALVREICAEDR